MHNYTSLFVEFDKLDKLREIVEEKTADGSIKESELDIDRVSKKFYFIPKFIFLFILLFLDL